MFSLLCETAFNNGKQFLIPEFERERKPGQAYWSGNTFIDTVGHSRGYKEERGFESAEREWRKSLDKYLLTTVQSMPSFL